MERKFKNVAVGGTFDELHKGHQVLILKAFEIGKHVYIGLSTDDLVRKMGKPHVTASYGERLRELKSFLAQHKLVDRADIVTLNDPYGMTLTRDRLDALVVSRETEAVATRINLIRKDAGMSPLAIVIVDMIPSENHFAISTTRIRRGEIDRQGRLLAK